jgi:hypothetical protein
MNEQTNKNKQTQNHRFNGVNKKEDGLADAQTTRFLNTKFKCRWYGMKTQRS